jgi:D-beta-D-heptose 7-phosphate kinase/D-beta-D-heptose 1-phosphate adenosyltransferase
MKTLSLDQKISSLTAFQTKLAQLKFFGKKIVFTNGCFDILHPGHLQVLHQAAIYGDYLIVGLNSDASVKRLKGATRPINDEKSRALIIANLIMVDAVILFEEDTPLELIKALMPNVLVKGGDYTVNQIVGANEVLLNGGKVEIIPTLNGFSTTSIIEKIK